MFKTSLILLFVMFSFIPGSVAQQPDDASMIVRVQGTDTYFRFDHTPVVVCPGEGYTEAWAEAAALAIAEINQVVGMVIGQETCDVFLSFPRRLPSLECGQRSDTWGCTWIDFVQEGDHLRMQSYVYILQNRSEKQWLVLHELLHALGIAGHSRNSADATYAYVQTRSAGLSDNDVAVLSYLYQQPAFR